MSATWHRFPKSSCRSRIKNSDFHFPNHSFWLQKANSLFHPFSTHLILLFVGFRYCVSTTCSSRRFLFFHVFSSVSSNGALFLYLATLTLHDLGPGRLVDIIGSRSRLNPSANPPFGRSELKTEEIGWFGWARNRYTEVCNRCLVKSFIYTVYTCMSSNFSRGNC